MTATTEQRLGLSAMQRAVLETIVYSDVFDFPLTVDEVQRWLPLPASFDDVEAAIASEPLAGLLLSAAQYMVLRGREGLLGVRERRLASSLVLRREARRYASLIERLPFVRMVALTGSLAVDSSEAGDDIDYLIVTAPGRVWLARAATMLVVRLAALRGVTVCPNYVLSESALELPARDAYTARELLQMAPLYGVEVYRRMLAANGWWRQFLPNAGPALLPEGHDAAPALPDRVRAGLAPALAASRAWPVGQLPGAGRPQGSPLRLIEALLGGRLGDRLEGWLYRRKAGELRGQAGGSEAGETVFDETMCKGHFEGYARRTREAVAARLREVLPA